MSAESEMAHQMSVRVTHIADTTPTMSVFNSWQTISTSSGFC